mmetsp:Transcript_17625/g.27449  ORF Transcript_17625/g.27449 Transcript_17625/m.27449 type:complete len:361 (+) Transcript_17625:97-1179(+)
MLTLTEITGNLLLFFLVFGMSATVDIHNLQSQLKNKHAILTGIVLQFLVLPLLGFFVVNALKLNHPMGVTLLVVTSSPGGSYSNWWCSLFNADLALSVCMTAISTLLSTIMLPLNLLIYATYSFDDEVVHSLDWKGLFTALVTVISAILLGLFTSAKRSTPEFNIFANKLGNISGILLVMFSMILTSSDSESDLWGREWVFYIGVAAPCILGLLIANIVTTGFSLDKPERITISIECCYQNVGIATSVALTMFKDDELAEALGVPLYYGMVEAFILSIYCVGAWKAGWTKAPVDEEFWTMIAKTYEVSKEDDGSCGTEMIGENNAGTAIKSYDAQVSDAEDQKNNNGSPRESASAYTLFS